MMKPGSSNHLVASENAFSRFKGVFAHLAAGALPDPSSWEVTLTNAGSSTVGRAGNANGASYMKLSLCPYTVGASITMLSKQSFDLPLQLTALLSLSQRVIGQECAVELVGVDAAGNVVNAPAVSDVAIVGTVSISSNVATVTLPAGHPFKVNDRVLLMDNAEKRLNVGPVYVTAITATTMTVACTLADGSYNAGGVVRWADCFDYANNAFGMVFENATATNANVATRRDGLNTRMVTATIATTNNSTNYPYSDPFNAACVNQIVLDQDFATLISRLPDSLNGPSGTVKSHNTLPNAAIAYKLRVRARNLPNLTRPVAKIVSAAKSGSTTVTIVTDVAHGLVVGQMVQIYGIANQTDFPNLTAQTAVASIINSTSFTLVMGTSTVTLSSVGGSVHVVHGSQLQAGVPNVAVTTIARTANVLTLTGNTNWSSFLPGETVQLYGCSAGCDGTYKVLRYSNTALELDSVGDDITSTPCGGTVLRRTDFRINALTLLEYNRVVTELSNAMGAADNCDAIPVVFASAQSVTGNVAEDVATSSSPVIAGGVVRTGTAPTSLVAGDACRDTMTSGGAKVMHAYAVPEVCASANLLLNSTTAAAIRSAGATSIRNYLAALQCFNSSATDVDVMVLDGAAEIWRQTIKAGSSRDFTFPLPLRGTAATAMNVNLSAAVSSVRVTAQTYQAT